MEFGKKGDAKKALKLAWKDHKGKGPLTSAELKRAWKKVHGPKSSKSSKSGKRVKNSPKKALKLAWKNHKGKGPLTSAELKKAWKKTMRFGDTVCLPGDEPNTWYTGGKGQRQCIKQCKMFQMRNPETNRCKNMVMSVIEDQHLMHVPPSTMPPQGPAGPLYPAAAARVLPPGYEINPATGRQRKMCVDPEVRNARGRCAVPRAAPVLQPGYEINPDTGRARKMCVPPEVRNAKGRCAAPRAAPVLQPGYEINPDTGRARKMCAHDQYRDPDTGRCKKLQFSVQPLIWQPQSAASAAAGLLGGSAAERAAAGPLIDFSFGRRNRYGGRKCGFGSCTSCNMK
jgi:hypothetical protein